MTHPANKLVNVRRRVMRARNFPDNTCPASRHLHIVADQLSVGKHWWVTEEPENVAGSIYAVLEALWKARAKIKRLEEK